MDRDHASRVLIVDDEPHIRDVLERWMSEAGCECHAVGNASDALALIDTEGFDLLLLDIQLPDMSGIDLLGLARERDPNVAAIMVTGVDDRETALQCLQGGAYGYLLKPFDEREVLFTAEGALAARRRARVERNERRELEEKVSERTAEIRRREEEIALRLVAAAEYRDEETPGHIRRIGMFAEALARALGWQQQEIDDIRVAAPMHDIGKIGVPDGILLKPGKLTPQEFEVVKLHAEIGGRLLEGSDVPLLQLAHEIALSHHERWDGDGYPHRLAGEQIPLAARLVALADVYDSLTHDRIYRPAFSEEEALQIMHESRGRQFDPAAFDVFVETLPAFRRIRQQVADDRPIDAEERPGL